MDISSLKNRIFKNLPVYIEDRKIIIVNIYEEFGLVDIKESVSDTPFVVDILTLSAKSYKENSISLRCWG